MIVTLIQMEETGAGPFLEHRGDKGPHFFVGHTQGHGRNPGRGNLAVGIGKKKKASGGGAYAPAQGVLLMVRPGVFLQPDDAGLRPLFRKGLEQIRAAVGGTIINKNKFHRTVILQGQTLEQPLNSGGLVMDRDNHRNLGHCLSEDIGSQSAGPAVLEPFKKNPRHKGGLERDKKDTMTVTENIVY